MNTMRLLITTLLSALLFCTINPISDNGGTTEIPNAKITGYLYKSSPYIFSPKDSTPVADAPVTLHSAGATTRSTRTDAAGFFVFDSVDTGRYWVEGNAYDTIGRVHVCDVTLADTTPPLHIVLRPLGGIRGKIAIDTTGIGPDTVYKTTRITIPEIELQLNINSTGIFETRLIPPFNNYTVVITNTVFPWIAKTFKVAVEEGVVTMLDNTNSPPVFTHDGTAMRDTVTINHEYRDTVRAYDPDGDSLMFIIERGPKDMSITDSIITWIPKMPCPHMGRVNVGVQVQDNRGGYDTVSWIITVRNRSGDR